MLSPWEDDDLFSSSWPISSNESLDAQYYLNRLRRLNNVTGHLLTILDTVVVYINFSLLNLSLLL